MLQLDVTNDLDLLEKLSDAIFGTPYEGQTGYILMADDVPAGLARCTVTTELCTIERVGVLPKLRKKGYGDFLTRVLMHNFSLIAPKLEIGYVSDYFLKFGFHRVGDRMEIDSDTIQFPCKCKEGADYGNH